MKNYIKILLHLLLWVIVLFVPFYIMASNSEFDDKPYIIYLSIVGILAILFYINYCYFIDKFLFTKRFLFYIVVNLVVVSLLILAHTTIMDVLFLKHSPPHAATATAPSRENSLENRERKEPPKHEGAFAMRIFSDYLLVILVIGMSVATKVTFRWNRDSMNLEKVKSAQLEADLRNLRSQLNPHFLFNTLNNIYSLIALDRDKAQESVHRLSSLLRYMLYEDDQQFVPINKDLEFTQNYIDLMKLRLSPSIKLNVTIEGRHCKDLIASLLFMTLIENAFKHGIHNSEESFVDISILVESGKGVLCTVENSIVNMEINKQERNSGIGLVNLSKRLDLLYPGKHDLVVERRPKSFFVMLRVDFNKSKTEIL